MSKSKKKPNKAKPSKTFIDGLDSYSSEFQRWKRIHGVPRLIGVFELPDDQFSLEPVAEKLKVVGQGHFSPVLYECEVGHSAMPAGESVGSGCMCVVHDFLGNIRPIVFVRSSVNSTPSADAAIKKDSDDGVRLLVLLHELGHALDVVSGTSFDHKNRRIDHVAAELYAHNFVIHTAKSRNYRLALEYYLDNLIEHAKSESEPVRVSAEQAMQLNDATGLRKWIAEGKGDGVRDMVIKYRRSGDAQRKYH